MRKSFGILCGMESRSLKFIIYRKRSLNRKESVVKLDIELNNGKRV